MGVCPTFGLDDNALYLQEVYNEGSLAFLPHIGNLAMPTTRETMNSNRIKCQAVFSHSDATRGAQTVTCQARDVANKGGGGRMADKLELGSQKYTTGACSISGNSMFIE